MQVIIDLSTAPEHVVSWVAEQMNHSQKTPCRKTPCRKNCELVSEDKGETPTPAEEQVETQNQPTKSDLLVAGKAFLDAKGVEELKEVLSSLDIPAVRQCPADKMAELLSRLALS